MYALAGRVGEEGIMVGGAGALVSGGRDIGRRRGGALEGVNLVTATMFKS